MKSFKYIYLIIGVIFLSLISCNDNEFLEENSKSIYTLDKAFEKSSQVEAQLTMCYYSMSTFYSYNFDFLSYYTSYGTDVMDYSYWRSASGGTGYSNFGTWSSTSGFVENIWNQFYKIISYANLTMLGAESENIVWEDEEYQLRLKAEASFFRGLAYLRLGELYGGVSLVTEFSEELKFDYVRSTRTETYQQAIDDLKYAYDNLSDYPSEDGRIAKGAAGHMLAEAYLAMGVETEDNSNYSKAINYASEIISLHPLMTDRFGVRADASDGSTNRDVGTYLADGNVYGDLFHIGNYDYSVGNAEAVWVIQTPTYEQEDETGGQIGWESFFLSPVLRDINWKDEYVEESSDVNGPWKEISEEYNTASYPAYLGGFGVNWVAATNYAYYNVWTDPADLRYQEDVTVRTEYECADPGHSMYEKKVPTSMLDSDPTNFSKYVPIFSKMVPLDEWAYKSSDNTHFGWNHDYYAIRSAETYLLLAEAYLRNNQPGLATDALNTVRKRAQCNTLYSVIDINSILDERIRELLFEEGRWFTLLRMEPDVWKQRVYDYSMYINDYDVNNLDIDFNLWPIPESVIQLNTGADFPQNSGWK